MSVQQKKPVWVPQKPNETNVAKFIDYVNKKHSLSLQTYEDLHGWSVDATTFSDFWRDAYAWLELAPPGSKPVGEMLDAKSGHKHDMFPPPRFFPSDALNIAEIVFRDRNDDDVAIYFARDGKDSIERVTWGSFKERTRRVRAALVNSGVGAGDVVAAVVCNTVDTIVISLAALSIGAIWSSTSCDMGTAGIVDRYKQVSPKIVFADHGYTYASKMINLEDRITSWSHTLKETNEGLLNVVVIPYSDLNLDVSRIYKGCIFDEFLDRDSGEKLRFDMLPFSQPAFILYSSGTTGIPKCIVHSAGGVALKVKADMTLQNDVRKSDVVFQYTTTSWVMWVVNLLNISCGASMLLYDGSPFHPRPTRLLELVEEVGVNVFGTSPRYLSELKSLGIVPRDQFNLSSLRVVTSTGSTLSAELYEWFYDKAFPAAQLISMSGGTDIAGAFVGGSPLLPVYSGEIQCKALGMAVDIFDTAGTASISIEKSGAPGELVCTRPFPSQPLTFIGKNGAERYRSSYFERFGTSVWCQGDFMQRLTDTGGIMMLGRSDGVLNPSGIRFGSAEIYSVIEGITEIDDSICVGQKRNVDADERIILFVKMKTGQSLTPDLTKLTRTAIRERYSSRHVPKFIFEVSDIPYTVNGKKCEINVKQIVNKRSTAVSGTVANPDALKLYEKYQDLPAETLQSKKKASKL